MKRVPFGAGGVPVLLAPMSSTLTPFEMSHGIRSLLQIVTDELPSPVVRPFLSTSSITTRAAPLSSCPVTIRRTRTLGPPIGRPAYGIQHGLVPRAATKMGGEDAPDLLFARLFMVVQKGGQRDDKAGRAKPALQGVTFLEGLLEGAQPPVRGQAFDRRDLTAVELRRQEQARANRRVVEQDRAGAADAVLATDVRAVQTEVVPEKVRGERSGLDVPLVGPAVDFDTDALHGFTREAAESSARFVISATSARR